MIKVEDLILSLRHRGDARADWWEQMQDAIKGKHRARILAMLGNRTQDFDFETQFKIIADAMLQD